MLNIFLNNLFLLHRKGEICNFADDEAIYGSAQCLDVVLGDLESDLSATLQCFKQNGMVANLKNSNKCTLGSKARGVLG